MLREIENIRAEMASEVPRGPNRQLLADCLRLWEEFVTRLTTPEGVIARAKDQVRIRAIKMVAISAMKLAEEGGAEDDIRFEAMRQRIRDLQAELI